MLAATSSENLNYRALWALFLLTGFLSSFPVIKDIDNWLLRALHRAAFISDEVRILAEDLYNFAYSVPPASVIEAVRPDLSIRDILRVAEKTLAGRLEGRIINILGLQSALESQLSSGRHTRFKIKLHRDLQEIKQQNQGLKAELRAYLRDQEKLVPGSVNDIDDFITGNLGNHDIAELSERRQLLQVRCDTFYETMCLLTALFAFATSSSQEVVEQRLNEMGFRVSVPVMPPLDWDTVARVIGSMFIVIVVLNGLLSSIFGLRNLLVSLHQLLPQMIYFSILFTFVYSFIMIFTIKLKRKWRRDNEAISRHRPENLLIAMYIYGITLLFFSFPFRLLMFRTLDFGPFFTR